MTTPLPVIISPNAADDLTASWVWLRDRNPRAADEWLAGIRDTILALGAMPDAHPIARNRVISTWPSAVRFTARRHAGVSTTPSSTGRCRYFMSVMAAGVTGNLDRLDGP